MVLDSYLSLVSVSNAGWPCSTMMTMQRLPANLSCKRLALKVFLSTTAYSRVRPCATSVVSAIRRRNGFSTFPSQ